ncbi:hypothetical protein KA119_01260 [Candidatus Gracilibacteria bacterium]|nr:hypothetical protein [Candidatus Gracilibacteria bacterium]
MEEENKNLPVNPLDQQVEKAQESNLLGNVVASTTEEEQNILGLAPEIDQDLLMETGVPKKGLLTVLKSLVVVILVLGVAGFLFFRAQLNDSFSVISDRLGISSIASELAAINSEILDLKTEANFHRYLEIKGYSDLFSYYGDSYLQSFKVLSSQTASANEKREAEGNLVAAREELNATFSKLRELYTKDFAVKLGEIMSDAELRKVFETRLLTVLNQKADSLKEADEVEAQNERKRLLQTVKLVSNNEMRNLVLKTDFAAMADGDAADFVKVFNQAVRNDLSLVAAVKDARVKWSDIMNEIELRTIAVDSYYSENFYNELGGIVYTSYDFDRERDKISLVGETKRFDTTNFTMIANLIDEFNNSELFGDAEMRSFSKSGSLSEGYTSVLKLDLNLTQEDEQ